MKVITKSDKLNKIKAGLLIVGLFEDQGIGELVSLDKLIGGAIRKAIKNKIFKAEFSELHLINTLSNLPARHLLLVGLGKKKEYDLEKLRKVSGISISLARNIGFNTIAANLHNIDIKSTSPFERSKAAVEGTLLGLYRFIKYKTQETDKIKHINSIIFLGDKNIEKGVREGELLANNTIFVRDLINTPANKLTPTHFAKIAQDIGKTHKIKTKVFGKKELEKLGFAGTLAVSQGSAQEPKFVVMEYGKGKTIALIGKGVTFDAGGINGKPWNYMKGMKSDMGGAAVVLGTLKAAAELKLPIHLIGLMPLSENMSGSAAFKVDDIIKMANGKTVEIGHTDAEGRLLLADSLIYAERMKPEAIIDIATLTGACMIALGHHVAGVMGDKKIVAGIQKSGLKTYERVWELPMYEEYKEDVKGKLADVSNFNGSKGMGGAITAATFLSNFVEKTPWAHIDIAGTGWYNKDTAYIKAGGTGFGVRLLIEFLKEW